MENNETELEMVQRHIRLGKAEIASQVGIVGRFRESGLPTQLAEEILRTLWKVQIAHEDHLSRVKAKLANKKAS